MDVKPGYKHTKVGLIPQDWEEKILADIGESLIGLTYKPTDVRPDGILVLRSSNIQEGTLRFDDNVFVDTDVPERIMVRVGDILICVRNGSRDLIGKCARLDEGANGMTFGAFMAVFRTPAHGFVYQMFQSAILKRQIREHLGATINQITNKSLNSFSIPFPSQEAEQEAIAEALSDADALIESLEQLIAKKRQIKHGAMQELLSGKRRLPGFEGSQGYKQTEVGLIPEDWGVVSAFEACAKIQDGTHFSPRSGGSDYRYVTSKNVRFGYMDLSTAGWIDAAQHKAIYRRCDVKKGDLLLTKDGANTGNAALNTLAEEFSLLSSVAFLRFNPTKHCAAYFLQQVLSSHGQRQIQDAMAGNAITRLTLEKINKLRFPVPPSTGEQEVIADALSYMDADMVALQAKLTKARHVKQGMMQELLTGSIRLV